MRKLGRGTKHLWRPLIGVVVAYAVAAQSLLIAAGGFALPAQAGDGPVAFELCLHSTQGPPDLPAGTPNGSGCSHCIFCFAGAHHALIAAPPALFHRVDVAIIDAAQAADTHRLPRIAAHSIASPRGPPLRA